MVEVGKRYVFEGPRGNLTLLDLFEGRRQLIVYHFMFGPGAHGWPEAGCPGCSMFVDQVCHLAHLYARDTSFALVSIAPLAKIEAYRKRMGWTLPWASSAARRRQDLPQLFHQRPWRRGARERLDIPRSNAARPTGGVGGLSKRLAASKGLRMVAAPRRI
jgi:predicted dithiol-disulfide oxidoreductase (DUF899 family)